MYITSTSGYYGSKPCVAQITKRKNRLKVYPSTKDQVYLNDGEEFEIELFNPKTSPVLAKISLNGKRISERGIILNPGQRIFLERFLDSPDKFKFSTYKVNNSKEVKEAIANNGLVKIEFYDEYISHSGFYSGTGGSTVTWNTTPFTYTNTPINTFYTSNLNETGSCFTLTSGISNSSIAGSLNTSQAKENKRGVSVETGRVEAGSNSDQSFQNGQGSFNSYTTNVVEYQILPSSEKNIEAKEIRSYCTECGTRNKQDWKFCPTCGNKF
jgi:hypothetical protein